MNRATILLVAAAISTGCSPIVQSDSSETSGAGINWEGPWAVAQGHYEGSPLFARVHQGVAPLVGDSRYSHQVGIAVPLLTPDPLGLPTTEEAAQLAEIEDAICAALEPDHTSVQVLSITTKGMREFVFYTTNADWVRTAFGSLQTSIQTHELQLVIQADPEWLVYRRFSE